MRSDARRRAAAEARAALEDWIELLIDQVRTLFSASVGVPDDSLVVFEVKEDASGEEVLDELTRVTLSTPQRTLVVTPAHDDFAELVECWSELRNALGALYHDVVPAAMVLEVRTHTFLLYDPVHYAAGEEGPSLVGSIAPAGSPAADPFLELLSDHEAEFDALVARVEALMDARGLSAPSTLEAED
jgi:hypothetical protein